jgi:Kef-type K+ transport system membrane component KefB
MVRSVEKQVRWFWRFVMMPLLFGLVGASVNFSTIERGIIPKACAIVIAGMPVATMSEANILQLCSKELHRWYLSPG